MAVCAGWPRGRRRDGAPRVPPRGAPARLDARRRRGGRQTRRHGAGNSVGAGIEPR